MLQNHCFDASSPLSLGKCAEGATSGLSIYNISLGTTIIRGCTIAAGVAVLNLLVVPAVVVDLLGPGTVGNDLLFVLVLLVANWPSVAEAMEQLTLVVVIGG